jgi:hypothetical protein
VLQVSTTLQVLRIEEQTAMRLRLLSMGPRRYPLLAPATDYYCSEALAGSV